MQDYINQYEDSEMNNIKTQEESVQKLKETKLPQCLQSIVQDLKSYKLQLFHKNTKSQLHPQTQPINHTPIQKNTQIWSIFIFILQKSLNLKNLTIYYKTQYQTFIKKCFSQYEQLQQQQQDTNKKITLSNSTIKKQQSLPQEQKDQIIRQQQRQKQSNKKPSQQQKKKQLLPKTKTKSNNKKKYNNLQEYRKQLVSKQLTKSNYSNTTTTKLYRKKQLTYKYKINLYTKQQKQKLFSLIGKIESSTNLLFIINFYKYFEGFFVYQLRELKYKYLLIQLQFGMKFQNMLEGCQEKKKKFDYYKELIEIQQQEGQEKPLKNNEKSLPFYEQMHPDLNKTKLLQKMSIKNIKHTISAIQVYQQLKKPIPNLSYMLNNYINFLNYDQKPWQLSTSKMFHFIHKLSHKQSNKFIVKFIKSKCFQCQAQYFSSHSLPKIRLYQALSRKMENSYGYYAVDKVNW